MQYTCLILAFSRTLSNVGNMNPQRLIESNACVIEARPHPSNTQAHSYVVEGVTVLLLRPVSPKSLSLTQAKI